MTDASSNQQAGMDSQQHLHTTTRLVAAYISANRIRQSELSSLIDSISQAIDQLSHSAEPSLTDVGEFGRVQDEITPAGIKCRLCGMRFKMLGKHLTGTHKISGEKYRIKFDLPLEFKLITAELSKRRSEVGKQNTRHFRTNRKQSKG